MQNSSFDIVNLLKEITCFAIRISGVPFLIRKVYARNKVSIIYYHDPKPDVLNRHLNFLSKRYNFIALDNLVNAIYSGEWTKLPPRSLIVTLDDGHKGNFDLIDIFKKYKITPTIYICSQIVNTTRHYWFKVTDMTNVDLRLLKRYSQDERRILLHNHYGFMSAKEYPEKERQSLSRKEIILMKEYVDFQSHSRYHPVLPTCADDETKEEIFQSKTDIENLTDSQCSHFAYPNGDYSEREIKLLRQAGYLSARTCDVGWNDLNTDPFKLRASAVTDNASINLLCAQMSGMTVYLRNLIKGRLSGKYPAFKDYPESREVYAKLLKRSNK